MPLIELLAGICAMFSYYHNKSKPCLVLNPPILFGQQHDYYKCCKNSFANLQLDCHLSSTKKFFRSSMTSWWNSLTNAMCVTHNYDKFASSIKDFYLSKTVQLVYFEYLHALLVHLFCIVIIVVCGMVGKNGLC